MPNPEQYRPTEETTIIELLSIYFNLKYHRNLGNSDGALKYVLDAGTKIGYKPVAYLAKDQLLKGFEMGAQRIIGWRIEQVKGLFRRDDIPESLKTWLREETGMDYSTVREVSLDKDISPLLEAWAKLGYK